MNRTLISAVVTAGLAALYFGDLSLLSSLLRCVFLVFTVLFYIILTTLMVIIFKLWTQQPVFTKLFIRTNTIDLIYFKLKVYNF